MSFGALNSASQSATPSSPFGGLPPQYQGLFQRLFAGTPYAQYFSQQSSSQPSSQPSSLGGKTDGSSIPGLQMPQASQSPAFNNLNFGLPTNQAQGGLPFIGGGSS